MGCGPSSVKGKKDAQDKEKKSADAKNAKDTASKASKKSRNDLLDIPVPDEFGEEPSSVASYSKRNGSRRTRRAGRGWRSTTAEDEEAHEPAGAGTSEYGRSGSRRRGSSSGPTRTPSPQRPQSNGWVFDDLALKNTNLSDNSSSSSAPQLFRISPTNRADMEEGSWRWWREQVRQERLTRDGASRQRLEDMQNRIVCQHDDDPTDVELDLGRCYMERTAPYIFGKLFASPCLREIRWITSLRLDGNYFTDHGFGNMLASMSAANEQRTVMPLLEQLYLNNMNLDRQSLVGICAYLFPIDYAREKGLGGHLGPLPEPTAEYAPCTGQPPVVPLFPSLSILSLSDNPGLGSGSLAAMLRWMLATHMEPHVLSALDFSRCGVERTAARVLEQYFGQLPVAITDGRNPVMPRSLVLLGNRHGIKSEADVNAPEEIRIVL